MTVRLMQGFNVLNFFLICVMVWFGFQSMYDALWLMHIINSIKLDRESVPVGGTLCYHFEVSRREICDPTVFRFVYRDGADGKRELVHSYKLPGAVGGVGKNQRFITCVKLPQELGPGDYETSGFVVNNCGAKMQFTTPMPRNFFTITAP